MAEKNLETCEFATPSAERNSMASPRRVLNDGVTVVEGTSSAVGEAREKRMARFWASDETERIMRHLDIWASVRIARKIGSTSIPLSDAIFEKPVPSLPEWLDPTSKLRITDWAQFRKDQTSKLGAAEEQTFLDIETSLMHFKLWRYRGILAAYFPRQGVYHSERILPLLIGEMPQADQIAIGDVIRKLRDYQGERHGVVYPARGKRDRTIPYSGEQYAEPTTRELMEASHRIRHENENKEGSK